MLKFMPAMPDVSLYQSQPSGSQLKDDLVSKQNMFQDLKKSMTLDFDGKTVDRNVPNSLSNLQTPDIIFALSSPELEKLIYKGLIGTPTPIQLLNPRDVTSEQEQYAKGFLDALNQVHKQNGSNMPTLLTPEAFKANFLTLSPKKEYAPLLPAGPATSNGHIFTVPSVPIKPKIVSVKPNVNLVSNALTVNPVNDHMYTSFYPMYTTYVAPEPSAYITLGTEVKSEQPSPKRVKIEEPILWENYQTVSDDIEPSASQNLMPKLPISAIDLTEQAVIKLERKRARNREAATRCRKRKMERIEQLEAEVREQQAKNADIERSAEALKQDVAKLRRLVLEHQRSGCPVSLL